MKEEFFKYLGPVNSMDGYARSYKLVFYKCFFELLGSGTYVSTEEVTKKFRQYYIDRKGSGLEPDVDVVEVIKNIEQSSLQDVYNLILRDPYKAISSKGYMSIEVHDGKECFELNKKLQEELTSEDIKNIQDIVNQKLTVYYSRISMTTSNETPLRDMVIKVLDDYIPAKSEAFSGNPLGNYFRNEIPKMFYDTGIVDKERYLVAGSVGQGNWAMVPWICIFDRRVTTSATKGVYIVYLLSKDGRTLYLTFNQGCTDIRNSHSKNETISIMRQKAATIIQTIDSRGFQSDENINLGDRLTELAELYQKGTIFYKGYKVGEVPAENELRRDLKNMLAIYQDYVAGTDKSDAQGHDDGGDGPLTGKETIDHIKSYIEAKGFSYEDGLIENFYLSLKSKPFVILAGISGTGKTRLARLFAEAVGATTDNGRYKMISVRPDWSDSSDLFGHVDLNGKFVPGVMIDFVKAAQDDPGKPYFVCLDEMNLARVEYYLSDILSVIETRDMTTSGAIVSDPLIPETFYGTDEDARKKYGTITLPDNLYIIGTVNMDETTFPFSRKVLDRANTIEFSYVNLVPETEETINEDVEIVPLDNEFFKTKYLLLNQCTEDWNTVTEYCTALEQINQILQKAGAQVGYRVRDEIVFYLLNNKREGLLDEDEAFDYELMQKILPRIQGSSLSVKDMLCDLFKVCAGDYDGYQTQSDDVSSKMMKALDGAHCKYKHSAEKIAFMVRRFEEDGFTSYWL